LVQLLDWGAIAPISPPGCAPAPREVLEKPLVHPSWKNTSDAHGPGVE